MSFSDVMCLDYRTLFEYLCRPRKVSGVEYMESYCLCPALGEYIFNISRKYIVVNRLESAHTTELLGKAPHLCLQTDLSLHRFTDSVCFVCFLWLHLGV